MNKSVLLAAVSAIALCGGDASAARLITRSVSDTPSPFPTQKTAKVLWNQNSNSNGQNILSMNFTSTGTAYNSQAADDFVIPTGKTWRITEVDVSGVYSGSGPANSENVFFYRNAKGMPGNAISKATFNNLQGSDSNGNFAITLPNGGFRLKAGHYWVSVIANMAEGCCGVWAWNINSVQHHDQATWQNPGGGLDNCRSWGTLENCWSLGPDLMFALRGRVR